MDNQLLINYEKIGVAKLIVESKRLVEHLKKDGLDDCEIELAILSVKKDYVKKIIGYKKSIKKLGGLFLTHAISIDFNLGLNEIDEIDDMVDRLNKGFVNYIPDHAVWVVRGNGECLEGEIVIICDEGYIQPIVELTNSILMIDISAKNFGMMDPMCIGYYGIMSPEQGIDYLKANPLMAASFHSQTYTIN